MRKVLVKCIRLYQLFISPMLGVHCRFHPSCSQYTVEAIVEHGCVKGLLYGLWRIMRCQPFSKGGYDPVPLRSRTQTHVDT